MPVNPNLHDHATEFYDDARALTIEDTVWWAVGRRAIIRRFLDRAATRRIQRILEIGCGSGGDLSLLARYGQVWGLERSPVLARRARERGAALAIYETDFFDQPIDPCVNLFCLFDVLEHIEDDHVFVRRLAERAHRDHMLLISVPACPFLYGPHDELLHHYRRYSRRSVETLLEACGYEVVHSGYFMFFLFPLAVASRLMDSVKRAFGLRKMEVSVGRVPGPINWLFTKSLQLEAWLGGVMRFPIGLWVFVLARRTN
jgi:SAM-dependent methyltransferase